MPRDGADIYHIPPGTEGVPDTTIESEKYNTFIHDVEQDLNAPRPIVAGGTGAASADDALTELGAEKATQQVVNFDSHAWFPGSFFSTTTATGAPVADHAFSGITYTNGTDIVVEARDLTDANHNRYVRAKIGGTWGDWIQDINPLDYVKKAGDTMTGHLVLPTGPADSNAVRKDYVDAADAAIATILALAAPINSPVFTGNPQAPTPTPGDNDTSLATTAFVAAAVAALPVAQPAASAAEWISNSAPTKTLTPGAVWTAAAPVAIAIATSMTPDFAAGADFTMTLNQVGHTLANPSNPKPGQKGILYIAQDGGGSRTITTWGSSYKFPGGTKPILSTGANAIDDISYAVKSATEIHCFFSKGMA